MIWSSAAEFWSMGGYGEYVWGSMGVSAALLLLEVLMTRHGHRQALDAVCEAMDAESQDAHDVQARAHAGQSTPPINTWHPGAAP